MNGDSKTPEAALSAIEQTAVTPRLVTFDTEDELREHALRLNKIGLDADVAVMDARGIAVLASVAGCYADGFYYRAPCEDGYIHCANGECCADCANTAWRPTFPVSALVGFDVSELDDSDPRFLRPMQATILAW